VEDSIVWLGVVFRCTVYLH